MLEEKERARLTNLGPVHSRRQQIFEKVFRQRKEMDQAGKSCLDCRRLHSFALPCPHKDNPLILKARFLDTGLTWMDPLTDEEREWLKLIRSICEAFI